MEKITSTSQKEKSFCFYYGHKSENFENKCHFPISNTWTSVLWNSDTKEGGLVAGSILPSRGIDEWNWQKISNYISREKSHSRLGFWLSIHGLIWAIFSDAQRSRSTGHSTRRSRVLKITQINAHSWDIVQISGWFSSDQYLIIHRQKRCLDKRKFQKTRLRIKTRPNSFSSFMSS